LIVHGDAKALEWCAIAYLSQDQVAIKEIWDKIDQHSDNQRVFGLPSRLIAKKFVFRLIYGGSAYAYYMDTDFIDVGFSVKQWQDVIDAFYNKYKGIKQYHIALMKEATSTGKIIMPTGRWYPFKKYFKEKTGEMEWPRTTILNYPVQGFGHDLMAIARVSLKSKIKHLEHRMLCTVHDSIDVDCPDDGTVEKVAEAFIEVFNDIPKNYEKLFGKEFNVPMTVELQYGMDLKDLFDKKPNP
jgi:DNA polymerase I-like protein with 3'-5' exonuclease and polymerase domains